MKVIIDIDDDKLKLIRKQGLEDNFILANIVTKAIRSAIRRKAVFPDNATNGDVIKTMFPNAYFEEYEDEIRHVIIMWDNIEDVEWSNTFDFDWWNAPYKGGTT